MRDKFSELIDKGIAKANYIDTVNEPGGSNAHSSLHKIYNMYWGAASGSNMRRWTEDGCDYIITGSVLRQPAKIDMLLNSEYVYGVYVGDSGYKSLSDFIYMHGYSAELRTVNGDIAMVLFKNRK